MSKNFWKLTTVGLAGYVIGRERRQRPYYSQAVRYSSSYNAPYTSDEKSGIITPILKRVEEKVNGILSNDRNGIPRFIVKRVEAPRFTSKATANKIIDHLELEAENYGQVTVADYLYYFKSNSYILANDEDEQAKFLRIYYIDKCYGWNEPLIVSAIQTATGDWVLKMPPIEKLEIK